MKEAEQTAIAAKYSIELMVIQGSSLVFECT